LRLSTLSVRFVEISFQLIPPPPVHGQMFHGAFFLPHSICKRLARYSQTASAGYFAAIGPSGYLFSRTRAFFFIEIHFLGTSPSYLKCNGPFSEISLLDRQKRSFFFMKRKPKSHFPSEVCISFATDICIWVLGQKRHSPRFFRQCSPFNHSCLTIRSPRILLV